MSVQFPFRITLPKFRPISHPTPLFRPINILDNHIWIITCFWIITFQESNYRSVNEMSFNCNSHRRKRFGMSSYKRRQRGSRKSFSKKYRRVKPKNVISSQDVMPSTLQTRFPYQANHSFTTTLGSSYTYVYRGNSAYDPDLTGGGAQPNGFDEMSIFYNRYTVLGSRIKVTISNLSGVPIQVCLCPTFDSAGTAYNVLSVSPHSKEVTVNALGSGNAVRTISSYMSTKVILGRDPLGSDDYSALFNTNPTTQWYWSILMAPVDSATSTLVVYNVTVTYYVLLSVRKKVAQS